MTEKSVFIEIMGEHPLLKVLDFFMVYEDFDYSMTDIAQLSGIGYSTLKLFWEKIETEHLVVLTRTVGKAKMYRLNLANQAVQDFKRFYWTITQQKVHEELLQEEEPLSVAH